MFNKDLTITCDYCKVEAIDTGENDTNSCNEVAAMDGWRSFKFMKTSKTLHLCPLCDDGEDS